MIETAITPDAQSMLLLCSSLGLPRDVRPLSLTEWNGVAAALDRQGARPGSLLESDNSAVLARLDVRGDLVERIKGLLSRGGQLALELERLQSRGIWTLTRADDEYPRRLKDRLKALAPAVICGAGPMPSDDAPALAIVGSRDADEEALRFTRELASTCVARGGIVVSGGARGVDQAAQEAAIAAGGRVHVVLADSLERAVQKRALREPMRQGFLTMMTIVHPATPFSAGIAMGRNKVVYALSSAAVVVSTADGSGGTWAGATEALKKGWVPVFVRTGDGAPSGNQALAGQGASPLTSADEAGFDAILAGSGERCAPPGEYPTAADVATPQSAGGAERSAAAYADVEARDAFELIAERLRAFCATPRTSKDVEQAFNIVPAQAKAWLVRATEEKLLQKLARPVRYEATEGRLFT